MIPIGKVFPLVLVLAAHARKLWIDELAAGTKRIGPLPGG